MASNTPLISYGPTMAPQPQQQGVSSTATTVLELYRVSDGWTVNLRKIRLDDSGEMILSKISRAMQLADPVVYNTKAEHLTETEGLKQLLPGQRLLIAAGPFDDVLPETRTSLYPRVEYVKLQSNLDRSQKRQQLEKPKRRTAVGDALNTIKVTADAEDIEAMLQNATVDFDPKHAVEIVDANWGTTYLAGLSDFLSAHKDKYAVGDVTPFELWDVNQLPNRYLALLAVLSEFTPGQGRRVGDFLAACVQLRVGHGDPNRLLREVDIEFAIKDIAKAVEQLKYHEQALAEAKLIRQSCTTKRFRTEYGQLPSKFKIEDYEEANPQDQLLQCIEENWHIPSLLSILKTKHYDIRPRMSETNKNEREPSPSLPWLDEASRSFREEHGLPEEYEQPLARPMDYGLEMLELLALWSEYTIGHGEGIGFLLNAQTEKRIAKNAAKEERWLTTEDVRKAILEMIW